jgi:hypothetical protein
MGRKNLRGQKMSVDITIQVFAQLQVDRSQLFSEEDKIELKKLLTDLPHDYEEITKALSNWCSSRPAIYDALLEELEELDDSPRAAGQGKVTKPPEHSPSDYKQILLNNIVQSSPPPDSQQNDISSAKS